jgi:hypothetical protein
MTTETRSLAACRRLLVSAPVESGLSDSSGKLSDTGDSRYSQLAAWPMAPSAPSLDWMHVLVPVGRRYVHGRAHLLPTLETPPLQGQTPQHWDRSPRWSQFRSTGRQRGGWLHGVRRDWRVRQRRSARCEQRGVKSNQEFGVAKLGTDGLARRSRWLSPAWWTGPPPIPRRGPPRATNRMTRPPSRSPRRELLADSGSEPGANAGPLFKEPAARMTQHEGWVSSRVGWTIPATHAKTN